ncbi:MAG: hypothetical protein A4E54_00110 [Pelotomaculum sp. PtaB.Bin117]|nr:MAG: hypothetical protein A4E54_00110 [Pelotomaculum sp. PtaB.Bin117]
MLSNGINVTSTNLTLAVDDLAGARAKAVKLAYSYGAVMQMFPEEQSGSKKVATIRLTVASEQAAGSITELAGIGALIERKDENKDITSYYNETLIKYHDTQAQINSAGGGEERQRLAALAASYKQQLDDWNAEAGKRVITLRLEDK